MTISASRYHDISCGHRVYGHEGKCQHLHGHNYRIHFTVEALCLDKIGRVLDFSVIKAGLCEWLEQNWDHKFLMWISDPDLDIIRAVDGATVVLDFNPTAENMAQYLVEKIGPKVLPKDVRLVKVTIEETRKCSATYEVDRCKC